jgi:curved DNA-binding protein CbpA
MEFEDYYGVLGLPRNAQIKDVTKALQEKIKNPEPARFELCLKAYKVLSNPYKRARYDKTIGHLMCITVNAVDYPNAVHYRLNSIQPYAALYALIEKFKAWIEKRYDFDWKEAQLANYSYHLENRNGEWFLLLRFPVLSGLEDFNRFLLKLKLIKPRD